MCLFTDSNPAFTAIERNSNLNCASLRQEIRLYIQARASGAEKSKFAGKDLLTLMMASPEVFTEEFIIDELIDFLTAGTQTT